MSRPVFSSMNQAQDLARQGRMHEALECYDRALGVNPDNDVILSNRAVALIALGRHDEAFESCKRAVAVNPNSADIWTNMGVALEKLKRLPEAAEALERAISLNPYDAYARALLGIIYQKLNQPERAEAQNRQLQELVFPNEYAGFFFGTAAFLLGILLGGIRGVEGKPLTITIPSQVIILFFFLLLCLIYWKSLWKLHEINRNVIMVPYPSSVQGDRSTRGMYVVLMVMIVVFLAGILLGSDIWTLL